MKTFAYKGFSSQGQSARGLIEAWGAKEARDLLSRQGIYAEWVKPAGASRSWVWTRRHIPFRRDARAVLYRELSVMMQAGLTLTQALTMLVDSPLPQGQSSALAGLRDRIREGSSLADAVQEAGPQFSSFEHAVIRSGEQSGQLGQVLSQLATHVEEQGRISDRLISALTYPAIVLSLGMVVGLFMLVFMLPWLRALLEENGVPLPWLTRGAIGLGQALLWIAPLAFALLVWGSVHIRRQWRTRLDFRIRMDQRFFNAPLLGSYHKTLVHIRFTRTLSLLLRNGATLMDALLPAARASSSPWVVACMEQEREAIRQGAVFSEAMARIPPLRDELPGWLRAGEASGDLPAMLDAAGARAELRWERLLTRTMTLLESGLMIVVGIFVFLLALSILLPILSMNALLQ